MISYDHITFLPGGREELFEEMEIDFPHLATRSAHDRYHERTVPWHWHQELELLFAEAGPVRCGTPHENVELKTGDIALVNANVLHTTHARNAEPGRVLLSHDFQPRLLAEPGSRIERELVRPLTETTSIELIHVPASDASTMELRDAVRASFNIAEEMEHGWELRLRNILAEIWLVLVERVEDRIGSGPAAMHARDERLKQMLAFVTDHFAEHIEVDDIAGAGLVSERECHRTFKDALGVTPWRYLHDYRIEQACRMLAHTTRPIGDIGERCGLGSPSRFAQTFRNAIGCTPRAYRALMSEACSSA